MTERIELALELYARVKGDLDDAWLQIQQAGRELPRSAAVVRASAAIGRALLDLAHADVVRMRIPDARRDIPRAMVDKRAAAGALWAAFNHQVSAYQVATRRTPWWRRLFRPGPRR